MSNPNKYAFRMILLLAIVSVISYLLFIPLKKAFDGNQEINGLIIFTFVIGVLLAFRHTFRLSNEGKWLKYIKKTDNFFPGSNSFKIKPILLAPVAAFLSESKAENSSLSTNSLSTILGGVSSRLDENRDIIRYIIGLLVFLGLLGTFWGLLQTISSVSSVIQSLEITTNENVNNNFFDKIISGLNAPMKGMSTAFSSSLFGLGTSLVLGFLDLQVSQANNRFLNELEDWLSQKAVFTASHETQNLELGEVALENLATISKNSLNNENEKVKISERLNELNLLLNRLTEKLDDEKNIKNSIDELNMNVKNIIENDKIHSNELINGISLELRALSKVIEKTYK